ncbi:MAG: hypothetical protein LBD35_04390, partial [Prevotellaceae bacterium]|nr:hypothetical protein [Prevotellaceae bacterium]
MKCKLKPASLALALFAALFATLFVAGCDTNNDTPPPAAETLDLGDGSDACEIRENTTLKYPNAYRLKGWVYVTAGATLTIEPGVVVKGDKQTKATLIVERGARIVAKGTKTRPIVFTSAQPAGKRNKGDWGGIIILGKARNNMGEQTVEGGIRSKHGGTNDADDSGILEYLRCEFAGVEYSTDNEINGITFGSVGSGTTVNHVQVSYSGDDSFEWFGGCVSATHLIAFRGLDDDFDNDNGYSGKVQFALSVRDPKRGDKSASNSIESDNNANGTPDAPFTECVFANLSLFGPVADPAAYVNEAGVDGSTVDARFQAALHLRRNTKASVFNSLIASYPIGLIVENSGRGDAQGNAERGDANVSGCIMAGCIKNFQDKQVWSNNSQYDASQNPDTFTKAYFERTAGNNRAFPSFDDLKLSGKLANLATPAVIPLSGSPA